MMRIHWQLSRALHCDLALPLLATLSGLVLSPAAFASDITVGSPVNGVSVTSPVLVRAHNIGCDGVPPSSFGYSIDNATGLVLGETAYDIDVTAQPIPAGTHTIHFKSWTSRGECPTVNTAFTVGGTGGGAPTSGIPKGAISSGDLDRSDRWNEEHDGGTPGKSKGSMVYPATTPLYDDARKFYMTYTDRAGERWSDTFEGDTEASNYFVVDTYVLLPNPSEVLNLEIDLNQVLANGQTVILSTQCAGTVGQWEYGYTVGKLDHWWADGIKCNPRDWKANVWHHIQIGEHRDANGFVTHDYVIFDGVESPFKNGTKESAHFLGWGKGELNVQFQIEGTSGGSGVVTAYIHNLTVYRWTK
jgi:hypothetical protein